MGRRKTGWEEYRRTLSAAFNVKDDDQRRAYEIVEYYRGQGRSIQSILTTALLASEGQQFQEPTLGDTAAYQIMVSVRELGELLEELRHLRGNAVAAPAEVIEDDNDDDRDYSDDVMAFLQSRRRG